MSSASSRFWVICCAPRKIWRSYCLTSCSKAAVSPAFARATSATSGWISSVAGDWMAGIIKRFEKSTLKSQGFKGGQISVFLSVNGAGAESKDWGWKEREAVRGNDLLERGEMLAKATENA